MSTTNPSPCFKDLEQRTTRAVEGNMWGVQAEISELEWKFKVADGKMQAHYHEQLEKLNWDWEALQEELTRRKEEGRPSTPKPSTPSPQIASRWKESAIPSGSGMLRTSPWVVLKDLLSHGGQKAPSDTKDPPGEEEADLFNKQGYP